MSVDAIAPTNEGSPAASSGPEHDKLIEIELFTDPGCPFAFSHEPVRRRLSWLFGAALSWRTRMIVLASSAAEIRERGVTAELVSRIRKSLAARSGMPMAVVQETAPSPTRTAALAVVAARAWGASASARLLRELRILAIRNEPLTAPETIHAAAGRAGIDPEQLEHRMRLRGPRTELECDMSAARSPSAAALSLAHRLTEHRGEVRYSAPSYLLSAGGLEGRFAVPGAQPAAVYETAIANLAPGIPRRPTPEDPLEVLTWAGEPLATAEVAAVMEIDIPSAASRLADVAELTPFANDGYWSVP